MNKFKYEGPGEYRTTAGGIVKIIGRFEELGDYPIVGVGSRDLKTWTDDGRWSMGMQRDLDLVGTRLSNSEPACQPLTEETPDGLYEWCDGKGGDWMPCAISRASLDSFIVYGLNGRREFSRGLKEAASQLGGVVRPYTPEQGPTIKPPEPKGEKPVVGILTDPAGVRWHASKSGDWVSFGENRLLIAIASGHSFEPE